MSDIAGLIERLEKATGPDRTLDCCIAVDADGFFEVAPQWDGGPVGYGYIDKSDGARIEPGHGGDQLVPRYTRSIDAALALTERAVPWANCHGYDKDNGGFTAYVSRNHVPRNEAQFYEAQHKTSLPLAILIATLRALLSQEKANG
jgi:hypothetical protein